MSQDFTPVVIEGNAPSTYQFKPGKNTNFIGHLLELSLGDEKLEADIQLVNPESPDDSKSEAVVGILTYTGWDGAEGKPLEIAGRLSSKNKAKLATANMQSKQSRKIKCKFLWTQYDDEEGQPYFKHFYPQDAALEGELVTSPKISSTPAFDLTQVRNYEFNLSFIGDAKDQVLCFCAAANAVIAKYFSRRQGA